MASSYRTGLEKDSWPRCFRQQDPDERALGQRKAGEPRGPAGLGCGDAAEAGLQHPMSSGPLVRGRMLGYFGVMLDEVFKVHELTLEPQADIRTCHAPCCHGVEPERRFKANRNEYHARVAVR